jgi:hypothetical protein
LLLRAYARFHAQERDGSLKHTGNGSFPSWPEVGRVIAISPSIGGLPA